MSIFESKNITVKFEGNSQKQLENLTNSELSLNEIGQLVGAIDDAILEVHPYSSRALLVNIKHPFIIEQSRIVGLSSNKRGYLINMVFEKLSDAPREIGLVSLAREISQSTKLNFSHIRAFAAGKFGEKDIGYWVWARFGFNAPLTEKDRSILPNYLKQATDLNDLFLLGGKNWWFRNGTGRDMIFELTKNSSSWKIWRNYLMEKGVSL